MEWVFKHTEWIAKQQQGPEDKGKTADIEEKKRRTVTDQAPEDPEKTKRIEELKRKQDKTS